MGLIPEIVYVWQNKLWTFMQHIFSGLSMLGCIIVERETLAHDYAAAARMVMFSMMLSAVVYNVHPFCILPYYLSPGEGDLSYLLHIIKNSQMDAHIVTLSASRKTCFS